MTKKVRTIITTTILSTLLIAMTGCDGEQKPLSEAEKVVAINKNIVWYENQIIGNDAYAYQLAIFGHDFKVTVLNYDSMIKAESLANDDEFYILLEAGSAQFSVMSNENYLATKIDDPLFIEAMAKLMFPANLDFVWDNDPSYVGIGQVSGQKPDDLTTYYLTEYYLESSLVYDPFIIYDQDFEFNRNPIVISFRLFEDDSNQADIPFTDEVYRITASNIAPDILRILAELFDIEEYQFDRPGQLEDIPDLVLSFSPDYDDFDNFSIPGIE